MKGNGINSGIVSLSLSLHGKLVYINSFFLFNYWNERKMRNTSFLVKVIKRVVERSLK